MIELDNVSLQRGPKQLLEAGSLRVFPGQRVGLVGANGAGKSSVFKLLLGELHYDAGDLRIPKGWKIAHMAQEIQAVERNALEYVLDGHQAFRSLERRLQQAEAADDHDAQVKLHAEMDAMGAYNLGHQAEKLLAGLGFSVEQYSRPVTAFSGGWRIRLNLAQALMSPSDLLLLDEPTNHLDLDAIVWFESWLKSYQGTLLLISHDREFLDNVVDIIAHIEHQQLHSYSGNYSAFERQRAERLALQQAVYEKQQQRRQEMERFVERFRYKASKAKQAQSRVKALEKMQLSAPAHADSQFVFRFREHDKLSDPLVALDRVDAGYRSENAQAGVILQEVSQRIGPGSRIGLLGPNGAGKSTLIETLLGELTPLAGERQTGEHFRAGYFAQHQLDALDLAASPLLHLQRLSPTVTEQELRNFLGGFDFRGDRVTEPVTHFSGGEKARLALAMVAWQSPNVLLLDEPTNHLDLEMRHALTVALQAFSGALVVVSHDRHLLANTVDEFWLVADGRVAEYSGDLNEYQQWLSQRQRDTQSVEQKPVADKVDRKAQRRQQAENRKKLSPLTQRLKQAETAMARLQKELETVEVSLADEGLYQPEQKARLQALMLEQGTIKQQIEEAEEAWLEAQEQLDQLTAELAG